MNFQQQQSLKILNAYIEKGRKKIYEVGVVRWNSKKNRYEQMQPNRKWQVVFVELDSKGKPTKVKGFVKNPYNKDFKYISEHSKRSEEFELHYLNQKKEISSILNLLNKKGEYVQNIENENFDVEVDKQQRKDADLLLHSTDELYNCFEKMTSILSDEKQRLIQDKGYIQTNIINSNEFSTYSSMQDRGVKMIEKIQLRIPKINNQINLYHKTMNELKTNQKPTIDWLIKNYK